MKYALLMLFAFICSPLCAGDAESLILKADSAYNHMDYEAAVKLYSQAIDDYGQSSDLYYNLGNSYYRSGHKGYAILCYERALRLNPRNSEARANLEFANTKIIDRPGERGTLLGSTLNSIVNFSTPNGWAWITFVLFLLTLAGAGLYFFTSSITLRKTGFFGGIVMLFITLFSLYITLRAASRAKDTDIAVVISPSVIMSTAPHDPANRSEEAMLVHEGTKVLILDSVSSDFDSTPQMWLDVEVDNTHRAWIKASDVERIGAGL